jgi:hypothetical protein
MPEYTLPGNGALAAVRVAELAQFVFVPADDAGLGELDARRRN